MAWPGDPGSTSGRPQAATAHVDRTRLSAPRRVAAVRATDHPSGFGGRVFRAMPNFDYAGMLRPVNPRLRSLHGLRGHPVR
jgi:acyl-CoA synthetase (NDP forming)